MRMAVRVVFIILRTKTKCYCTFYLKQRTESDVHYFKIIPFKVVLTVFQAAVQNIIFSKQKNTYFQRSYVAQSQIGKTKLHFQQTNTPV
jgi:hypothetical protein